MSSSYVQRSTDRLFMPSEHRHTLTLQSFQVGLGTRLLLISLTLVCEVPVNQIVQLSALLPWS